MISNKGTVQLLKIIFFHVFLIDNFINFTFVGNSEIKKPKPCNHLFDFVLMERLVESIELHFSPA